MSYGFNHSFDSFGEYSKSGITNNRKYNNGKSSATGLVISVTLGSRVGLSTTTIVKYIPLSRNATQVNQ